MAQAISQNELFETLLVPVALRRMIVPAAISQIIVLIYNMADTFYIGRTNNPYMLAGASLILPVFNMLLCLSSLAGIGGGTLISRLLGAGQQAEARKVSAFSFWLAVALSLAFSVGLGVGMTPALTFLGLCAVQAGYTAWALGLEDWRYSFAFNQLPAFAGVLALGFAAASAVARLGCRVRGRGRWGFSALAAASLWAAARVLRGMNDMGDIQHAQLIWRMPLIACLALALIGLCLGVRLPGGRLWAFLSGISFSYYMWHQWLAVQLKYHLRLPPWQGDTPPNQLGDTVWMWRYFGLILAVSLAAAVLLTYGVERPAAARLRRLLGLERPKTGQIPQNTCK